MNDRGFSVEVERLAAELNTSFEQQRAPDFDRGAISAWVEAVNLQMTIGQFDVAEYGLRHLRERFPSFEYVNRVGEVLSQLPLAGPVLPFADDPIQDIQIVESKRSETAILIFCGSADNLGLPLAVIHRWAGRAGASLIYLRDFRRKYFLQGIESLGSTRDASIAALRGVVDALGVKRIACLGASSGGFAAASYALDLGVRAVLCLGGTFNLTPEFNAFAKREQRATNLRSEFPDTPLDIFRLYATAPRTPQLRLIYGADYWDDRIHAEHMGHLPCVTLQPLEGFGEHNVVVELIRRGQLEAAIRWLVASCEAS